MTLHQLAFDKKNGHDESLITKAGLLLEATSPVIDTHGGTRLGSVQMYAMLSATLRSIVGSGGLVIEMMFDDITHMQSK